MAKREEDEYSKFVSSIFWQTSKNGNPFTFVDSNRVTVFEREEAFSWCINLLESDDSVIWAEECFETIEDAIDSVTSVLFDLREYSDCD